MSAATGSAAAGVAPVMAPAATAPTTAVTGGATSPVPAPASVAAPAPTTAAAGTSGSGNSGAAGGSSAKMLDVLGVGGGLAAALLRKPTRKRKTRKPIRISTAGLSNGGAGISTPPSPVFAKFSAKELAQRLAVHDRTRLAEFPPLPGETSTFLSSLFGGAAAPDEPQSASVAGATPSAAAAAPRARGATTAPVTPVSADPLSPQSGGGSSTAPTSPRAASVSVSTLSSSSSSSSSSASAAAAADAPIPTGPKVVPQALWVSDKNVTTCYDCGTAFTFFNRKHHCRLCGQIFCARCSSHSVAGKQYGQSGSIRVCNHCYQLIKMEAAFAAQLAAVTAQAQQAALSKKSAPEPARSPPPPGAGAGASGGAGSGGAAAARSPALSVSSSVTSSTASTPSPSVGPASPRAGAAPHARLPDSTAASGVARGLPSAPNGASLAPAPGSGHTRQGTLSGAVNFLEKSLPDALPEAGRHSGGLGGGLIGLGPADVKAAADAKAAAEQEEEPVFDEEDWSILGSYAPAADPQPLPGSSGSAVAFAPEQLPPPAVGTGHATADKARAAQLEDMRANRRRLQRAADAHLQYVVTSLVLAESTAPVDDTGLCVPIPRRWIDLILGLATRCVAQLRPSVRLGDAMDIRSYVKVKCIGSTTASSTAAGRGGSASPLPAADLKVAPVVNGTSNGSSNTNGNNSSSSSSSAGTGAGGGDCEYVDGVAFRKAVPHRRMRMVVVRPHILLLKCAIEYQRVTAKMSDLRTLFTAEKEYIELQVRKIVSVAPDIVVVEKTVSRLAQDLLHKAGVILLSNVKPQLIDRLARACEAPVLHSTDFIDASRKHQLLGTCALFRCHTHGDCDTPQLQQLLRAGSPHSLPPLGTAGSFSSLSGSGISVVSASASAAAATTPGAASTASARAPSPSTVLSGSPPPSSAAAGKLQPPQPAAASQWAQPDSGPSLPPLHRPVSTATAAVTPSAASTAPHVAAPMTALEKANSELKAKLARRAEAVAKRKAAKAAALATATAAAASAAASGAAPPSSSSMAAAAAAVARHNTHAPYKFRLPPQMTAFDELPATAKPVPLPVFVTGARPIEPRAHAGAGAGPSAPGPSARASSSSRPAAASRVDTQSTSTGSSSSSSASSAAASASGSSQPLSAGRPSAAAAPMASSAASTAATGSGNSGSAGGGSNSVGRVEAPGSSDGSSNSSNSKSVEFPADMYSGMLERRRQSQLSRAARMMVMYFEGCKPELHATLVLRGEPLSVLERIKRILKVAIHVAYTLSLETAFWVDHSATYTDADLDTLQSAYASLIAERERAQQRAIEATLLSPLSGSTSGLITPAAAMSSSGGGGGGSSFSFRSQRRVASSTDLKGLVTPPASSRPPAGTADPKAHASAAAVSDKAGSNKLPAKPTAGAGGEKNAKSTGSGAKPVTAASGTSGSGAASKDAKDSGAAGGRKRAASDTSASGDAEYIPRPPREQLMVARPLFSSPFVDQIPVPLPQHQPAPDDDSLEAKQLRRHVFGVRRDWAPAGPAVAGPNGSALGVSGSGGGNGRVGSAYGGGATWLHQNLLLGSCWLTNTWQCFPPKINPIEFYTATDKTLGQFLFENCFDLKLRCMNGACKRDVLRHTLGYTHHHGRVTILVRKVYPKQMPQPLRFDGSGAPPSPRAAGPSPAHNHELLLWSWCKSCKRNVAPCVAISEQTYQLSFGKFLELMFYNTKARAPGVDGSCTHSIATDHVRFFGFYDLVASFEYETVLPLKMLVTPRLTYDTAALTKALGERLQHLSLVVFSVFQEFVFKIAETDAYLDAQPEHLATLRLITDRVYKERELFTACLIALGAFVSKGDRTKAAKAGVPTGAFDHMHLPPPMAGADSGDAKSAVPSAAPPATRATSASILSSPAPPPPPNPNLSVTTAGLSSPLLAGLMSPFTSSLDDLKPPVHGGGPQPALMAGQIPPPTPMMLNSGSGVNASSYPWIAPPPHAASFFGAFPTTLPPVLDFGGASAALSYYGSLPFDVLDLNKLQQRLWECVHEWNSALSTLVGTYRAERERARVLQEKREREERKRAKALAKKQTKTDSGAAGAKPTGAGAAPSSARRDPLASLPPTRPTSVSVVAEPLTSLPSPASPGGAAPHSTKPIVRNPSNTSGGAGSGALDSVQSDGTGAPNSLPRPSSHSVAVHPGDPSRLPRMHALTISTTRDKLEPPQLGAAGAASNTNPGSRGLSPGGGSPNTPITSATGNGSGGAAATVTSAGVASRARGMSGGTAPPGALTPATAQPAPTPAVATAAAVPPANAGAGPATPVTPVKTKGLTSSASTASAAPGAAPAAAAAPNPATTASAATAAAATTGSTPAKSGGGLASIFRRRAANDKKSVEPVFNPTVTVADLLARNPSLAPEWLEFLRPPHQMGGRVHWSLPSLYGDASIPVYDDEPSSLIAYALTSVRHIALCDEAKAAASARLMAAAAAETKKQQLGHAPTPAATTAAGGAAATVPAVQDLVSADVVLSGAEAVRLSKERESVERDLMNAHGLLCRAQQHERDLERAAALVFAQKQALAVAAAAGAGPSGAPSTPATAPTAAAAAPSPLGLDAAGASGAAPATEGTAAATATAPGDSPHGAAFATTATATTAAGGAKADAKPVPPHSPPLSSTPLTNSGASGCVPLQTVLSLSKARTRFGTTFGVTAADAAQIIGDTTSAAHLAMDAGNKQKAAADAAAATAGAAATSASATSAPQSGAASVPAAAPAPGAAAGSKPEPAAASASEAQAVAPSAAATVSDDTAGRPLVHASNFPSTNSLGSLSPPLSPLHEAIGGGGGAGKGAGAGVDVVPPLSTASSAYGSVAGGGAGSNAIAAAIAAEQQRKAAAEMETKRRAQQTVAELVEEMIAADDEDATPFKLTFADIPPPNTGVAAVLSAAAQAAALAAGNPLPAPDAPAAGSSASSPEAVSDFSVSAYYPKHFHALRLQYCGGDYDYIQSLSRCDEFVATGGKKATFSKTRDERFLLKYIDSNEFELFLKFAPAYFEYMRQAMFYDRPTLLVPYLGLYLYTANVAKREKSAPVHVPPPSAHASGGGGPGSTPAGVSGGGGGDAGHSSAHGGNAATNAAAAAAALAALSSGGSSTRYVVVLPNLFYGRNRDAKAGQNGGGSNSGSGSGGVDGVATVPAVMAALKVFDLKGLARNRLVDKEASKDAKRVLLDVNLMQYRKGFPVSVAELEELQMSVANDTSFLCANNLVDYSILVGFDEATNEMLVGIIDYLRDYDMMKKLEHLFKSVYGNEAPTIVSPKQYKVRFRLAMDRYFMSAPNRATPWTTVVPADVAAAADALPVPGARAHPPHAPYEQHPTAGVKPIVSAGATPYHATHSSGAPAHAHGSHHLSHHSHHHSGHYGSHHHGHGHGHHHAPGSHHRTGSHVPADPRTSFSNVTSPTGQVAAAAAAAVAASPSHGSHASANAAVIIRRRGLSSAGHGGVTPAMSPAAAGTTVNGSGVVAAAPSLRRKA